MATPSPNGSLEAIFGKISPNFIAFFAKLKLKHFFLSFQFSVGIHLFILSFLFSLFSGVLAFLSCSISKIFLENDPFGEGVAIYIYIYIYGVRPVWCPIWKQKWPQKMWTPKCVKILFGLSMNLLHFPQTLGCHKWGCNKWGFKGCLAALPENRPKSDFFDLFLPFSPFSGGPGEHLGNPENGGKRPFSSDILGFP